MRRLPGRASARASAPPSGRRPPPAACDVARLPFPARSPAMRSFILCACCVALLAAGPGRLAAAGTAPAPPPTPTPAQKLAEALKKTKEIDVKGQLLTKAVEQLSQQTGVPFAVDRDVLVPSVDALHGLGTVTGPVLSFRSSTVPVG